MYKCISLGNTDGTEGMINRPKEYGALLAAVKEQVEINNINKLPDSAAKTRLLL